MIDPVYASQEHKNAIEAYIAMCDDFVQDVSTKTKHNSYKDVLQIILEYHTIEPVND